MSREFVDAIVSGNNIEAEKAFTTSISTKVGDALEVKRKEISSNFVKGINPEEIDADS
jgi:phosphotransferase system IIB component